MNNRKLLNSLSKKEISEIKEKVNCFMGWCKRNNSIIKEDIFNILQIKSRTIYYPIKDDHICGFVYRFKKFIFTYINTNIPREKQVFAAAHELYHILYSNDMMQELVNDDVLEENELSKKIKKEDLKANRFAAEILVPEDIIRNEIAIRNIEKNKLGIKEIVQLMDIFLVPYKTIVRRLYEIEYINIERCYELLNEEDRKNNNKIIFWQKRLGVCNRNNERTNSIKLDKLVDMSLELYEKKAITFEKLTYLLGLSKLKPDDFNIKEEKLEFPSEDEILKILED